MTIIGANQTKRFIFISQELIRLEEHFLKNDIIKKKSYKNWLLDFKKIYPEKDLDIKLYIIHGIYYIFALILIYNYLILEENSIIHTRFDNSIFKKVEVWLKKKSLIDIYRKLNYFDIIVLEWDLLIPLILTLNKDLNSLNLTPEYYFDCITHELIPSKLRHKLGEYYTPPFLVKRMIKETYLIGMSVLDPCCGTGNFIIETTKFILNSPISKDEKIKAINNLNGHDLNPISIFAASINLLLITRGEISDIKINFIIFDSLFEKSLSQLKYDLIIGNPPWYTYRNIESIEKQQLIKNIAEDLEIKPRPKNILNIEISTLFFYKAREEFMKDDGNIFFVITKGVFTGSHASRFRNFAGFDKVKAWFFESSIEKVFNIDFICLFAQKRQRSTHEILEIPVEHYKSHSVKNNVNYYDDIDLEVYKTEIFVPYSIVRKKDKIYTKKYIPKSQQALLISLKESYYKKLFHKGADLNPRNLIFVVEQEINDFLVRINHDRRIFNKSKPPWSEKVFQDEIVEKENIFNVIKSTEIIKFGIYDKYRVFLPVSIKDSKFILNKLQKHSTQFYNKINSIYLKNKKSTTKHKTLFENLNRWNKLTNMRQLSPIKVVYNNSGSTLNAALIEGDFLVTGDLSFFATLDKNEAFYLSAVLNSPLINEQVQIKKSSRHIFKIPFETPIAKYDPRNKNHIILANLGEKCDLIVRDYIKKLNEITTNLTKIKLQKDLGKILKNYLEEINKFLLLDLKNPVTIRKNDDYQN